MDRRQVGVYSRAFAAFRQCVAGDDVPAACAAAWTREVSEFLPTETDRTEATEYASYYVDFLRKGGGASPDCAVKER